MSAHPSTEPRLGCQLLNMSNAPPKWSKLWTDIPRPGDDIGAYTTEQLEHMNQEFTTAVERAFHSGDESESGGRNIRLETPI